MQGRVLYDKLSDFDRVLAGFKLEQSTEPNPLKRESENNKFEMAMMDLMWRASEREGEIHTMPALSQGGSFLVRLMMFQPKPVPFGWIMYCFRFDHPAFRQLVNNCTNAETKEFWQDIIRLHKSHSDNHLESRVGSVMRLVRQTFALPAFRERCSGDFDLDKALTDKQIIIIDGSDDGTVSKKSVTAVYGAMNLQIDQVQRKHFTRTGKVRPVLVVWEEAAACNIIGSNEINMLRELRKTGFAGWVISQDLAFIDPTIKQTIKSCTAEHVWYNCGDSDLALEAAEDIVIAQLNPELVKQETQSTRMQFKRYVAKTRKGVSKTDDRKTESESDYEQAEYEPVTDIRKELKPYNEQIQDGQKRNLTLRAGERERRNRTFVTSTPEYIPMLKDPWPESMYPALDKNSPTLAEIKLAKAIAESQARPEFKTPVVSEETWTSQETTTQSGVQEHSKPSKNLPKPRGRQASLLN
jgi:hypothetical protein